ncbi:Hypothetical predicted protein [Mytilus galloprovincialis]|uniref:Uncharacterized protein n=1 Tax=Mytilus galloprovincialis TaxID=29158 RepID=A0A8B6FTR6_MYTGA|nr:Hypothetical predicted protein [Mytilus galloprovincialis]
MSWCDLPEFDGTELFEGFWMKFSILCERLHWSSSDMAFYLVTSLREATEVEVAQVSELETPTLERANVEQQTVITGVVEAVNVRQWSPFEQSDILFYTSNSIGAINYDEPKVSSFSKLPTPVYVKKDFTHKERVCGNAKFTRFKNSNVYENSYI